jgi:selenocysteine lyase/cysteine desulfurase
VYLDYAGAGLPAQAQLAAHAERIRGGCFGNPHSENPTSAASTELIERARRAVLTHFNALPQEYAAIFTPNATGACRLVGEAYAFGPRIRLVLTQDNHNSVNGIREFARSRGAVFGCPTGVGCLIARREALARLWRPWFAGGSVYLAGVQGDWHTLAPHEARFEDGNGQLRSVT